MPFTFAHPAAVLPLSRYCPRFLNLPALIAGSMVPDLGYYTHNWTWAMKGHTFAGMVTFDIPAGLLLLGTFYLSTRALAELLPSPHKEFMLRLSPGLRVPGWKATVIVVLSLLLGASTHILWDGFTHGNGWCVRQFSALTPTILSVGSYHVTVWQLLQHASTALGLALLALAYKKQLELVAVAEPDENRTGRLVLLSSFVVSLIVSAFSSTWAYHSGFSIPNTDIYVFNAVVTFVCLFLPLTFLSGFALGAARGAARKLGAVVLKAKEAKPSLSIPVSVTEDPVLQE